MLTNVPNQRLDFNFILVSIYIVRYCSIKKKERTRPVGGHSLPFCTAKVQLLGCVVTKLRDTSFDLV